MRRKKLKYNSDHMSRLMDEQLEQLEDTLTALYANAAYEVNAVFAEYAKDYEKALAEKQALLASGDITQAEYNAWVQTKILQTSQYKATIDSLTTIMVNADVAAMAIVNGELPYVVAQSFNFTQSLGWKAADDAGLSVGTFQIYNVESVQTIIKDNPDLLPQVNIPEDEKWNRTKINNEITQGIVQGKPIDKVAEGLQRVTGMDENAAIRNARTAMTAAENLGRTEASEDLRAKGIPMVDQWSATYDDRTRDTHLMLDGTTRSENGTFGDDFLDTPLRFPGDPNGDPEEIYNCRCRLNLVLAGIDHSQDDDLYEKFMKENYPDDWKNLQENKGYIAKQEQAYDAKQRQADLKAGGYQEMQERKKG